MELLNPLSKADFPASVIANTFSGGGIGAALRNRGGRTDKSVWPIGN